MTNKTGCEPMPSFSDQLRKQKNAALAALLRCDDSTVSRIKHGELGLRVGQIDALLDELGLELVPAGSFFVEPGEWLTLKRMARRALDHDIALAEQRARAS